MGVFGEFLVKKITMDFELAAVQAGEGGERSEQGNAVREDYLMARLGSVYPIKGAFSMKLGLTHQTLSYSSNAFMNVDTVPFSSAKLLAYYGNPKSNLYAGFVYGFGSDGQSIPEFNAKYDVKAYGVTMGFFKPF